MAPKTRAKSKPPATEAAAAAASPSAPRAKRGRAAAAAETLPQTSEGEANNLAQGGAYEALQQEMAIMRRELADLRQPPETTLAPPLRHSQQSGAEPLSPSLTPPPPAPILRGDPSSPLSLGLDTARWPARFKMPDVTPFEGCTDPSEFLRVYETAVEAAGGDDTTKAKSITLALKGVALTWFFTIPPRSIYAWEQLRDLLRNNFQGNYIEPKGPGDLFALKQAPGESLRAFFRKFAEVKCQVKNINEATVINAATCGLQRGPLAERLARKPVHTVAELFDKMEQYARAEEDSARRTGAPGASTSLAATEPPTKARSDYRQKGRNVYHVDGKPSSDGGKRGGRGGRGRGRGRARGGGRQSDNPFCELHGAGTHTTQECRTLAGQGLPAPVCEMHGAGTHSTQQCRTLAAMREYMDRGNGPAGRAEAAPTNQLPAAPQVPRIEAGQGERQHRIINMISGGSSLGMPSKRQRRAYARQIHHLATYPLSGPPPFAEVPISFGPEDARGVYFPHQDPLVVSADIADFEVRRVLVDGGSSADLLFIDAFDRMMIPRDRLTPPGIPLIGFGGKPVTALGQIKLAVTFRDNQTSRTEVVTFDVVQMSYQYNAILGRATLNAFGAVAHHNYLCMKMPAPKGIVTIRGDQDLARHIELEAFSPARHVHNVGQNQDQMAPPSAKWAPKPKPQGQLQRVPLRGSSPERTVAIGSELPAEAREAILEVLRNSGDIFAWTPEDLPGVPRATIEHRLSLRSDAVPKKQKLRRMSAERLQAAKKQVAKLLQGGIIREIKYSEWLANPVLVKKKETGTWRMCVDFTDLNKACPKDDFPLPRIDQLVDATSGCELMSFLDAYSGYHQVLMASEDEPKTAFITPIGTYCYNRMPFGLKNAGATFARLIAKVLATQLGRNAEAYVDDIVIKSRFAAAHAKDLQETFHNLREGGIKLNPEKCAFGVKAGKLLGFLVSERGIEANPEKIRAIQDMKPPQSARDVQKLTGRLAALSRFLSRSAERALPFFKTLRGAEPFRWTDSCQKAFEELKQYLTQLPSLTSPEQGAELLLYIAASPAAVSAVLVQEHNGQRPVYYVSEALQGAKTRYTELEKLAYALLMASRKLRHYFLAHSIMVQTSYPLALMLRNKDASGRIGKWAAELAPFDIIFAARTAIKSQALADFVAEWTPQAEGFPSHAGEVVWTMHTDGSWCATGAGAAAILSSPDGRTISHAARLDFPTTNNASEYEALLLGLRKAKALGAKRLIIKSDSRLVAGHFDRSFVARCPEMSRYLAIVRELSKHFLGITIQAIPRGANEAADRLAKMASAGEQPPTEIFYETITKSSAPPEAQGAAPEAQGAAPEARGAAPEAQGPASKERQVLQVTPADNARDTDWRHDIVKFLAGEEPEDSTEARRLLCRARNYRMVDGQLYKSGVCAPLLRCISQQEGQRLLEEVHEGLCGAHQAPRGLVARTFRQGFYWPTALRDAQELVQQCQGCQWSSRSSKAPALPLQPIPPVWPFARWGMDIIGPYPPARSNLRFAFVAIEYFSRWVEAEPVPNITAAAAQRFTWKNIICRYGVPRNIVTDNGTQFDSESFRAFCNDLGITVCFASVGHPESNGAVERANGSLVDGLKKRLVGLPKGAWPEELQKTLWALRTSPTRTTGFSPFKLLFGDEAMTPGELAAKSHRATAQPNQADREVSIDLLEERRIQAVSTMSSYTEGVARAYNKKVKPRTLEPGDMVLKRATNPTTRGKLESKWEGPYIVTGTTRAGTFRLATPEGDQLGHTWNIKTLRKFYP